MIHCLQLNIMPLKGKRNLSWGHIFQVSSFSALELFYYFFFLSSWAPGWGVGGEIKKISMRTAECTQNEKHLTPTKHKIEWSI
jgi:hypothetical protein